MLLNIIVLSIILFASQINSQSSLQSSSYETAVVCLKSKTVFVGISTSTQSCQVGFSFSPKIRDDYTATAGVGAYKLHTQGTTWNEARKICESEGAHLAIINSKAEQEAIAKLLVEGEQFTSNSIRHDLIWLGAHNLFNDNEWVTVLGKSLSSSGYVNWSTGCLGYPPEPNNPDTEHCLSLYHHVCDRGLNDFPCHLTLAFVCERSNACTL